MLAKYERQSAEFVADLMASGQPPGEYLVVLCRDKGADPKDRTCAARTLSELSESAALPRSVGLGSSCRSLGRPAEIFKALSVDLREQVVRAVAEGVSCRAAAVRSQVSASSAIRIMMVLC